MCAWLGNIFHPASCCLYPLICTRAEELPGGRPACPQVQTTLHVWQSRVVEEGGTSWQGAQGFLLEDKGSGVATQTQGGCPTGLVATVATCPRPRGNVRSCSLNSVTLKGLSRLAVGLLDHV